jgi:uracil-DNA glycosylase
MSKMLSVEQRLARHVKALLACRRCPHMNPPPVSGGPVVSRVILVGQAPGTREPIAGRPFAWTAGRKLFRWFEQATGLDEAAVRREVYFAAVCRCFPGKNGNGGDRVPSPTEVEACAPWLERELELLQPELIILVGKLAIARFLPPAPLDQMVGRIVPVEAPGGRKVDALPLPHPSGASPWPHQEPGRTLLARALKLLAAHPAMREIVAREKPAKGEKS